MAHQEHIYCSNKCKQKAYRQRQRDGIKTDKNTQVITIRPPKAEVHIEMKQEHQEQLPNDCPWEEGDFAKMSDETFAWEMLRWKVPSSVAAMLKGKPAQEKEDDSIVFTPAEKKAIKKVFDQLARQGAQTGSRED